MLYNRFLTGVLASVALATLASANDYCWLSFAPSQPTDWTRPIALPRLDPSYGGIRAASLTFHSRVRGSACVENTGSLPATLQTNFQAAILVTGFGGMSLFDLQPSTTFVDAASGFDGVQDYSGTSGTCHTDILVDTVATYSIPQSVWASLVGTGNFTLDAFAMNISTVMGSSSLASAIDMQAGVDIVVCYTYAPDCNHNGIADSIDISSGHSADVNHDNVPDECQASGTQGCSLGYWKNHTGSWGPTGYRTNDDFDTVFTVNAFTPNKTLLQALNLGGGGLNKLARQGTAALLNSTHPGVDFPLNSSQVISLIHNAIVAHAYEPLATTLEIYDTLGCPLN